MKITFVLDSLQGGGFERRMSQLICGLTKSTKGHDINIIMPKNATIDYNDILGKCEVINFSSSSEFCSIIRSINPEIVHSCSPHLSLLLNRLRLTKKFKYILGYIADANMSPIFSKRFLGYALSYPFADAIISNSIAGLEAYRCPKHKSHVIYNGFDPKRLDLPIADDLLEIRRKYKYVIIMAARVGKDKDFISYANIAFKMKNRQDIVFLIVGKGEEEDNVKKYCKDKNITNTVFMGFRSDIMAVFNISDISILLSKIGKHKEGVSNSIMESMATGTPVIATNEGGTPEIIRNKSNGFLVNDNDEDQIVEYIQFLLNDRDIYTNISLNAKDTIRDRFLLSKMIEDYEDLYKSLLR